MFFKTKTDGKVGTNLLYNVIILLKMDTKIYLCFTPANLKGHIFGSQYYRSKMIRDMTITCIELLECFT